MKPEYIVFVIIILMLLVIKSIFDKRNDRKKLIDKLLDEWGKDSATEYHPGKLESIKAYYNSYSKENDVDDITWNDLDMDEMFMLLNNTQSAMGEEVLYKILRQPVNDRKELNHRSNIINFMYDNQEDRLVIQQKLFKIGKDNKLSFYEFLSRIDNIKIQNNLVHYVNLILLLACVIGGIMNFLPCIFAGVALLIISIFGYYKRKAEIESYYYVFGRILKLLYNSQYIAEIDCLVLKDEISEIKRLMNKFSKFKRNSGIVLKENGGNISDIIFDYIRMITYIDLIKFNNMYNIIRNNKDDLLKLHGLIGYIDSMIAIASFRKMMEDKCYCEPDFCYEKSCLDFENGYHPYLTEPVYNDFNTANHILLTGSNASGKSTFLKTIALNAILAQTIMTVCASSYKTSFFKVMTSMALNDNIFSNKSYFIVEILSLKRILDSSEDNILVCIDEVLRGTNTIERIAASGQILKTLSAGNTLCFAATHDIELTNILSNIYTNYHFREKIEEDNVIFDYKIHEGPSKTKNAIKLLNMLGYDKNIVDNAVEMAKNFEENNVWLRI